jgi:hypothetical protein
MRLKSIFLITLAGYGVAQVSTVMSNHVSFTRGGMNR